MSVEIETPRNGRGVRVPLWAVGIIAALLLNAASTIYAAGTLTQRVAELERRMGYVEQELYNLIREIRK